MNDLVAHGHQDQHLLALESPEGDWLCNELQLPIPAAWFGGVGIMRIPGERIIRLSLRQAVSAAGAGVGVGVVAYDALVVEVMSLQRGPLVTQEFPFREYLERQGAEVPVLQRHGRVPLEWRQSRGQPASSKPSLVQLARGIMCFIDICAPESEHRMGLTAIIRKRGEADQE